MGLTIIQVTFTTLIILAVNAVAPIWKTSQFVQAAGYRVIDGDVKGSATTSADTPTATMTFASGFPGIPNLGYGFTNYQAEDTFFDQKFQINRTALTTTSFSVLVQITGFTNIWILEVRYVAISPAFPHHLNSFDNVPINYGRTLVNISTKSTSTQTFTNTINYTAQATAAGSTYKYFNSNLGKNKILTFITSLFIEGTLEFISSYPLNLLITATPMTTQTYNLAAVFSTNARILRLHFSMITFDQADVQNSGKYQLIYDKINYTVLGGHYPFQAQFLTNFMIGFTQFSTAKTTTQLHFILIFQIFNGNYGVRMLEAIPRITNKPMSRFCLTIFYLKTWICPDGTYFDSITSQCITCSVTNCNVCLNTSYCVQCSTNYALNSSTGQCYQQCTLEGCTNCINMTACLTCNATLNYVLVANLTCVYCPLNLNYFPNATLQSCQQCTLSNCLNCSSLTNCRQCNTAASYYVGITNICEYCNNSQNFFINSSLQCQSCLVANCLACQTLTTCQTCNPGYLINTTNSQCASCSLSNCATCSNLTACQICSSGYVLNSATEQCQVCTLTGCLNCSSTTTCTVCNTTANYILSGQTCQLCTGGMFANSTSNTCESCGLPNCLTCSSLTSCSSCNTGASFYLSSGTCSFCDPTANMFINSTTLGCQVCTIPFCSNCSSLSICQTCSPSYVINTTDNLCYPCTLLNCVTCSNLTSCGACDTLNGFALNTVTGLCQVCTLVGCSNCSTTTTCSDCNQSANYILSSQSCQLCTGGLFANSTTNTCESCTLSNCLTCTSLKSCSSCNTNASYYLSSNTCSYCDPGLNMFINSTTLGCQVCTIPYCSNCSSLIVCDSCDSGYVINPSDNLCYQCTISNCISCSNLTYCGVCDTLAGYALDPNTGNCQVCNINGCTNCSSITTCAQCNTIANFVLTSQTCTQCTLGLFANATSSACESCTLSNCLVCTSLTSCSSCNTTASYYLSSFTCSYCDPTTNMFINLTTLGCQTCTIPFCSNCTSLTACLSCDSSSGYFINTTDNLCYPCTLPNCVTCSNLTSCGVCDTLNGFALNPATGLCQVCTLAGCSNCSTTTTCADCNQSANYILSSQSCQLCTGGLFANSTTNTCQACTLSNCLTCSSLTSCSSCNTNASYYLSSGTCSYCDPGLNMLINSTTLGCQVCTIPLCSNCSSLNICQTCNPSYVINTTDNLCYPCTLSNCVSCSNLTSCGVCDTLNGFALNPVTGLCQVCTLTGCSNCSTTTTCVDCNQSANYILSSQTCQLCTGGLFANSTTNTCQACTLSQCLTCSSLTNCISCNTNASYYLFQNTCSYCDPTTNMFINSTTLGCEACSLPFCSQCSSLTVCSSCNNSYVVNTTDNLCYPCTLSNCLVCANFTSCSSCDESSGYFLNSTTSLCELCNLQNCLVCSSLTKCSSCDTLNNFGPDFTSPNASTCGNCSVSCLCDGYGFPWRNETQTCTPICGDGLLREQEQCDDNNNASFDGCSSQCKIEKYYICAGSPSSCNQTLFIEGEFVSIEKYECNSFKIKIKTPNFTLKQISQNIFILNQGVSIMNKEQVNEFIEIYAQYTRDMTNETILLQLNPGMLFNVSYTPSVPPLYYTQKQCQTSASIENLIKGIEIASYIVLISSLLSCKIVGLQLFGVLQLSYFTLSAHSFLNLYLSPLVKFKTFNGLNIGLTQESSLLPDSFSKMNLSSSFINNCNIMLFILFGELIFSLIVYVVGKLASNEKVQKIGKRLLKQGFITLVLFNIFNISFSAGVHLKYADPKDEGYFYSSILLFTTIAAMIISVLAMQLTDQQNYGEFKGKFKNNWVCRLYIPLTICYRMVLGFYAGYNIDYDESTLIVQIFSITFLMFFFTNLPFSDFYQNYRSAIIHLTMAFTLLTTNYYRSMKSTTPMQIKGKLYMPALIELILIASSLIVSFFVLLYEIFQILRKCRKSKKLLGQQAMSRQSTQQSFETLH